jgi:ATP-dependent Clp protease ATP-binding subunit ClpC
MFERYTEKARRVIFFARYEASQYGSPNIETEHLLLGFLREDPRLQHLLNLNLTHEAISQKVEDRTPKRPKVATSVDLPLSNESKRVLAYAAEEADELNNRHIGTEHLLLGLLREKGCFAAAILKESGLELEATRKSIAALGEQLGYQAPVRDYSSFRERFSTERSTIRLHGLEWDAQPIRAAVSRLRETSWHWEKKKWQSRDIVISAQERASLM